MWNVSRGSGRMSGDMDVALPRSARPDKTSAQAGFEQFYRDSWEHTYRTLTLTIRDHDLAREAVDEAMVRALDRWRHLQDSLNPAGWVYRVAFNWAIDQIRRKGRERRKGLSDRTEVWVPDTPRPDLTEKLNQLSLEQRAVVVLRVVNDWSENEVAEALDIPVGTVKSRLSRALEILRVEVDSDE